MYLKLQRQPPDNEWLRGKLYHLTSDSASGLTSDSKAVFLCDTLERTSTSIPPLSYPIQVTMSPKFKRLLPLVMNVPNRSGIRIHVGTRPEHSTGCILVPNRTIERELTQLLLTAQNRHEPLTLTFTLPLPNTLTLPLPNTLPNPA